MTVCDSGYTVKEKKVNKKRKERKKKKGKEINTYQLRKKCINEEPKKKKNPNCNWRSLLPWLLVTPIFIHLKE